MDTQLKKGVLGMCVLALLNKKDHYGYELVIEISKKILISEGTIYPLLRRLKNEGYVTTYLKESSEGPSRKYYQLTNKGKKKNKALTKEWGNFSKNVDRLIKGKK